MAASFPIDHLLETSQSMLDESRELLASLSDRQVTSALLMNSRAMIAESRRLLAALEQRPIRSLRNRDAHHVAIATAPASPAAGVRANADDNQAMLSVRVFKKGSYFGWTIYSPTNDPLGRGTAETEQKARIDAFRAGMTYLDRAKGRSASSDSSLH